MKSQHWIAATLALAAAGAVGVSAASVSPPPAAGSPVLVELFQSQGCSSCPPANANLNAIADRPDVIPLSFAVTYWDQLGWKDTFATPRFTARQWDYAHSAGRGEVATPQMVINGGKQTIVGNDRQQLEAAITAAPRHSGPQIRLTGDKLFIGAARGAPTSTIWVVRYDPRVNNVPIRAGENGGRTLPHRNIVRQLTAIGTWSGAASSFALPPNPNPVYRTAVLVQSGKGGPIVAAARS
ncbi:DUF1223 domain-containing protein [Sphingomonas quercus]|uniref:DUF1223 domain-containing protein n=1 Tax=Sphingomonas quercus TaxID=2842451 RepID=A0ABS6BG24_9SPHN|nr:DUF1223 domain-containing protein [Sphingomonas quercus]MBU3076239.1 DUF1223 domain-containing protein [Sphingomonas quercus]